MKYKRISNLIEFVKKDYFAKQNAILKTQQNETEIPQTERSLIGDLDSQRDSERVSD